MFLIGRAPWWLRAMSLLLIVLVVVDISTGDGRLLPVICLIGIGYVAAVWHAKRTGRL
jgi:hypothetical protein